MLGKQPAEEKPHDSTVNSSQPGSGPPVYVEEVRPVPALDHSAAAGREMKALPPGQQLQDNRGFDPERPIEVRMPTYADDQPGGQPGAAAVESKRGVNGAPAAAAGTAVNPMLSASLASTDGFAKKDSE